VITFAFGAVRLGAQADPSTRLLETNAARFVAMTSGDAAALDTLLATELTYIHTDGELETKTQFLATLRNGQLQYQAIQPYDLIARVYGDAGVVTGGAKMRVYRYAGLRWTLVAWQATRLPRP
jgi:hypothetical protein